MGRNVEDILRANGIELRDLTDEELDELAHAGVKGMRWGKRKKSPKSEKAPKVDVKSMSDDDLKKAINRLKLEREFKQLTTPEVSQGRKIVGEILKDVGKQHAKKYLNNELEKLLTPSGVSMATKLAVASAPKPGKQVMQFSKRPGFE
jgi:hypothetical protein